MSQKSVKGSLELAKSIKLRRNELSLTIEEAALKAGVGTKTWSRYEAGESIRKDKCRGICKALSWPEFPTDKNDREENVFDLNEYKQHEAWSPYLFDMFGMSAAISFVIGSDLLLDYLHEDMDALSSLPKESHIGQIDFSWIKSLLPTQFLMNYNYEFLYIVYCIVTQFRLQASTGNEIVAHSVIEELTLYLIMEESRFLMESIDFKMESDEIDDYNNWDEWVFEIFDDMDLISFLYSDRYLTCDHPYHFDSWLEQQFYCE